VVECLEVYLAFKITITFIFILLNFSLLAQTKGYVQPLFNSCKEIILVNKDDYESNRSSWVEFEEKCHKKIQVVVNAGISKIDPLKEAPAYLNFATTIASKVIENLIKNQRYAKCSALCFSGHSSCPKNLNDDLNEVNCLKRIVDIKKSMNETSKKVKSELALTSDAPGLLNVNIQNVLSVSNEKMVNTNLRDFEIGTPNPIGRIDMSEEEIQAAKKIIEKEKADLIIEMKNKKITNTNEWLSIQLMNRFENHRNKYRELIYIDFPLFGVIDRPTKLMKGESPEWSNDQYKEAFLKLEKNSSITIDKTNESIKNARLEFNRANGEALKKWISSFAPGTKEKTDLLYYIGMTPVVEEYLKDHPESCALATTMKERLESKEIQNSGSSFAASLLVSGALKGVSSLTGLGNIFRIGRALTGAEALGLTGLGMGSINLADGFNDLAINKSEVLSKSGLSNNEGKSIKSIEELNDKRESVKLSMTFLPIDLVGGWGAGKTIYQSLGKKMLKDMPELNSIMKQANKGQESAIDSAVDKWLVYKLKKSILSKSEKEILTQKASQQIMDSMINQLNANHSDFLKNPENIDYIFKLAARKTAKQINDPSDLTEKALKLLENFNKESTNGMWDPIAHKGMLKFFDHLLDEMRDEFQKNPEQYLKIFTNSEIKERLIQNALKKSGASEIEIKNLYQCLI
jgi:hypothetical protein